MKRQTIRAWSIGALCILLLNACSSGDDQTDIPAPVAVAGSAQSVGGKITGLAGSVVLQNNGGDSLSTSTDGAFNFQTLVAQGGTYAVSVATQPAGQTCSVSNGTGKIGSTAVQNVNVVCSTNAYTVGGTVSGLAGQLTVQDNGGDALTVGANGAFTFPVAIAQGGAYAVTVQSKPANQTCTVSNGAGTMGSAAIKNVLITCSTITHTVGGTISGLVGQVQLQNNGADTLTVANNGAFTFATPVAEGSTYAVSVLTQPIAQTCTVQNGNGTTGTIGVTNVGVTCVTNTTTLWVASTGIIPVKNGTGSLTVTNTGPNIAVNVAAVLPSAWSGVTQDASQCATLAVGASCTLAFSSITAYVAQGNLPVVADNVNSPPTTALAFTVGGFLVFAVPSTSTAIVVDRTDIGSSFQWGPNTTLGPPAQSLTDGAANTNVVASLLSATMSAAKQCNDSISGSAPAGSWYLPAVCEMTDANSAAGCPAGTPNIAANLANLGFGNLYWNMYWTSTESAMNPQTDAWTAIYYTNPVTAFANSKSALLPVRCARTISY